MKDVPPEAEAGPLDEGTNGQERQHRPFQAATSALVPPQPAGVAPQPPPSPQPPKPQQPQQQQQQQQPQPAPLTPPPSTPPICLTGTVNSTSQRRSPTQAAAESTAPLLPQHNKAETIDDKKEDDNNSESSAVAAAAAAPAPAAPAASPAAAAAAAADPDTAADAPHPPTHEFNISGALIPVPPPAGAGSRRAGAGGGDDAEEPRDGYDDDDDETANFYEWRDVFPELEALVRGLPEITAECLQVASWKAWPEKHYEEGGGQDWKVFPFVHTFPAYDESRRTWVDSSCKRCPDTAAILRRLPNIRTALFSRLGGGSRIAGHRGWADLANHVLRCHLPIKVPSDGVCGLWVESEVRRHVEGEIMVFDDSKLHKAFNDCTEERLVLIVDLLRPPGVPLGTADGDHTPELDAFIEAFR